MTPEQHVRAARRLLDDALSHVLALDVATDDVEELIKVAKYQLGFKLNRHRAP
jgi:hypothetical protein